MIDTSVKPSGIETASACPWKPVTLSSRPALHGTGLSWSMSEHGVRSKGTPALAALDPVLRLRLTESPSMPLMASATTKSTRTGSTPMPFGGGSRVIKNGMDGISISPALVCDPATSKMAWVSLKKLGVVYGDPLQG